MLLDGGDANYGIKCVYKEPSKEELDQGRTGAAIFMSVWWCPDGRRLTLDIASCIIARRHQLAKSSEVWRAYHPGFLHELLRSCQSGQLQHCVFPHPCCRGHGLR